MKFKVNDDMILGVCIAIVVLVIIIAFAPGGCQVSSEMKKYKVTITKTFVFRHSSPQGAAENVKQIEDKRYMPGTSQTDYQLVEVEEVAPKRDKLFTVYFDQTLNNAKIVISDLNFMAADEKDAVEQFKNVYSYDIVKIKEVK